MDVVLDVLEKPYMNVWSVVLSKVVVCLMMILAIYNYIHTLFQVAGPKVVVKNKSRGPFAVSHTSYNVMTS